MPASVGIGAPVALRCGDRLTGLRGPDLTHVASKTEQDLAELIDMLQEELLVIRGESRVFDRELASVRQITTNRKMTLAEQQRALDSLDSHYRRLTDEAAELQIEEAELRAARQRLTEEMARLQPGFRRAADEAVGGIPVDSEYIVFVIDTSGSMQAKWDFLLQKLEEVLNAYPTVRGLQIMNDNGIFMFPQFGKGWLQDTPQIRQAVKNAMRNWRPWSDSNPAQGLIYALETFSDPLKKVSIYVFGDDFTGHSAQPIVHEIDRINVADADGNRAVRIHAIGFLGAGPPAMARRYAGLMRAVTEQNGGTFVGLTERDRR